MILRIFYFFLLLISYNFTFAQKKDTEYWEMEYKTGKEYFEKKDFKNAMEKLKPVAISHQNNPYASYSAYYYSLSAFNLEMYDAAHLMLLQLRKNYPSWNKMSEVFYLLANISFIKGNLAQAVSYLDGVYDEGLHEDKQNMKVFYLRKYAKKNVISELYKAFPHDQIIAEILSQTLIESEYSEANQKLMEQLLLKFDSEKIKHCYTILLNSKTTFKDSYNIAVMLPFYLEKKNIGEIESRRSQMSLDMIQGIKMGVDTLRNQSTKLNLFTYDITLDTTGIRNLIKQPELKKMDLMLGPVFNAPSRIVSKFAKENEIGMVNPLSPNDELLKDNDYVYLVKPSITMQARKMAEYAYQNFVPRKAVILFSSSELDKTFATTYKEEFERLAGEVSVFKEISKTDMDNVATIINSFPLSGVGHIYVPSSEERIVVNLLSILDVLRIRLPIVGISDWLNFESISFEQMERNQVYFVNADFIDYTKPECRDFRTKFYDKYKTIPSVYAYYGYDIVMNFGKILKENGYNFHDKIHSNYPYRGILLTFDYRQNSDNQHVIIYKFMENQLKPLNGE